MDFYFHGFFFRGYFFRLPIRKYVYWEASTLLIATCQTEGFQSDHFSTDHLDTITYGF